MKISRATLTRAIPEIGSSSLGSAIWDLEFEQGLLWARRIDRPTEEAFIVPASHIVYMRAEGAKPKK